MRVVTRGGAVGGAVGGADGVVGGIWGHGGLCPAAVPQAL